MRKLVPGWRYFRCSSCKYEWREACRDHATPSDSVCPVQGGLDCYFESELIKSEPMGWWPTDCGNLIRGVDYEALSAKHLL